jgi:hypothetical protein
VTPTRSPVSSGGAAGVAHATSSLSTENASSRRPACCGYSVVHEKTSSASPIRVRFGGLKGDNFRGVVPPFVPPALGEGCDKLTLTLTATRGRAR